MRVGVTGILAKRNMLIRPVAKLSFEPVFFGKNESFFEFRNRSIGLPMRSTWVSNSKTTKHCLLVIIGVNLACTPKTGPV